jgi:leader peptidase (prepilin peptidase)/N-methyltransferase
MDQLLAIAEFYYHPVMLFVVGACIGSFLNVVIYRYPLGKSVVSPGSACPHCEKPIAGYDNIPILSWLILGGKCRNCKTSFSPKYMFNEAFYAVVATMPHWFDLSFQTGLPLSAALLAACPTAYLMFKHQRAPWYLWLILVGSLGFYAFQVFSA